MVSYNEDRFFCIQRGYQALSFVEDLLIINNDGVETLGLLDVDGLDIGVELLLGALLVVTLAADADAETEGNTLDTGFPDLLVQLGVEADVLGALLDVLDRTV